MDFKEIYKLFGNVTYVATLSLIDGRKRTVYILKSKGTKKNI